MHVFVVLSLPQVTWLGFTLFLCLLESRVSETYLQISKHYLPHTATTDA